jgi:hypothetical protein
MANFNGSPEIKLLTLDFDKIGEIERDFRYSIEDAKRFIDSKESGYRNQSGLLE